MATLAEIRAKIAQQENRNTGSNKSQGDGLTFPFWDKSAESGATSVLRILPDGDADNTFFWKERQMLKLTFPGVKGGDQSKEVTIQVPCIEYWDGKGSCPVLNEIRPWFKNAGGTDESEELARKYWIKRTYIMQGFVRESAITEENIPENPIRKFMVGPQLFGIIKASLMDPELETNPTDYVSGIDFRLTKIKEPGKFADYNKSSWSRKESALTEAELQAIEKYGLVNLDSYLPEKPNSEQLNAIYDMFQASVAGDLYDPERWAKYYKPYGLEYNPAPKSSEVASTPKTEAAPEAATSAADDSVPFEVDKTAETPAQSGNLTAQEILAKINSRDS